MSKELDLQQFNLLCRKCRRTCRQPVSCVLVDCPRYLPMPFKVEKHKFDQLDLFGGAKGKRYGDKDKR